MKMAPGQGMDGMHTYRRETRLPHRTHPKIRPLNKPKQMASTKTPLLRAAVPSIQPKPRPDNRDITARHSGFQTIYVTYSF